MNDASVLAASLASVAIAGLFGGPWAAGAEALKKAIPLVQARLDSRAELRALRQELTATILRWAASEQISEEDIALGLSKAVEVVARLGFQADDLAAFGNDPEDVRGEAIRRARGVDRYWGTEDYYQVAERAIEITYRQLIRQYTAKEPVLAPILQTLRTQLNERLSLLTTSVSSQAKELIEVRGVLDELRTSLVARASATDLLTYLYIRMDDWDRPGWLPTVKRQSCLELELRIRVAGFESEAKDFDQIIGGCQLLTLLGGPGSGKTWLARRFARIGAQRAADKIEQGVDLSQVEIPLFTTWSALSHQAGGDRRALVEASFAQGLRHSDLGGSGITDRIKRTLCSSDVSVLGVVDSLDEASDWENQSGVLESLLSIGWRLLVTSRPAAWERTRPHAEEKIRTAEILPLRYPDDVEGFVSAWFDSVQRVSANSLLRELRNRSELQGACTIPLILTFYCILAAAAPEGNLPAQRRRLFRRLIELLVANSWKTKAPGPDALPHLEDCLALLQHWAWAAVGYSTTSTGLGQWRDTFIPPPAGSLPPLSNLDQVTRAVSAIAPRLGEGGERGFIHRSFLEHLVAEHIATLTTSEAAEILLPHLWFDPDWEVALPAALAAHNVEQPGRVLEAVVHAITPTATDLPRREALLEPARMFAQAAREANGQLWSNKAAMVAVRGYIDATLIPAILKSMVEQIGSTQSATLPDLAADLHALGASGPHLARAIAILSHALSGSGSQRGELARALTLLWGSTSGNSQVVRDLLECAPAISPSEALLIACELPGLGATDDEMADFLDVILLALPRADGRTAVSLARLLPSLAKPAEDQARAFTAVIDLLPKADPVDMRELSLLLPDLANSPADRERALVALLEVLPCVVYPDVDLPARVLEGFARTRVDRTKAISALIDALPRADEASQIASMLLWLQVSKDDRVRALSAAWNALPNSEHEGTLGLARAIVLLSKSPTEKSRSIEAILQAFPASGPYAGLLREEFAKLHPSASQWSQATDACAVYDLNEASSWWEELRFHHGHAARTDEQRLEELIQAKLRGHTEALADINVLLATASSSQRARLTAQLRQALPTDIWMRWIKS